MRLKNWISITLMLALLGCWAFQVLPVLGVSKAQAQEPPLPTYSRPDNPFPDPANLSIPPVAPNDVPDATAFRALTIVFSLFVDDSDINPMLPDGWSMGGNTLQVGWYYQILSQWPDYYPGTFGPSTGVSFGLWAYDSEFNLRWFILADFRSPASAMDKLNEIFGRGYQISRVADLKMEFESEIEIDESATIKFKGEIKEPSSGLKLKINAKFPDGPPDSRVVNDPLFLDIAYIDVSTSPPTMGRPFRWSDQYDLYEFYPGDPGWELEIVVPNDELHFPGGRTVQIQGFDQSFALRRNIEGVTWFLTE